jgi:hypothetical protein
MNIGRTNCGRLVMRKGWIEELDGAASEGVKEMPCRQAHGTLDAHLTPMTAPSLEAVMAMLGRSRPCPAVTEALRMLAQGYELRDVRMAMGDDLAAIRHDHPDARLVVLAKGRGGAGGTVGVFYPVGYQPPRLF